MKLLNIKDLHISFQMYGKQLKAVRGVTLTLNENEKIGIVGESGCGKTVLAKAIAGLLPSHTARTEGVIEYRGQNLLELPEKELRKVRGQDIGMIFQDPMTSLNPTMRIGDQIREGHPQCNPIELLSRVGIPDPEQRAREYPHTLSGGLRQRVLIAIALASNPRLLIADEPTTALDVTVQAQILDLLEEVQKDKSVILITHDFSVVARSCDRVIVMYAGRIVEDASAEELFSAPKHPYTQRLLKSIPRLDLPEETPLIPIAGAPPDLGALIPGCAFCSRCSEAMNICRTEPPPLFSSKAACWLYDPRRRS